MIRLRLAIEPFLPKLFTYNPCMQTLKETIEQKRAEVAKLLEEIELLESAQKLLGTSEPKKRMGRPKGSKNKAAVKTRGSKSSKKVSSKASKKASRKGSKRGRKKAGDTATPAASS